MHRIRRTYADKGIKVLLLPSCHIPSAATTPHALSPSLLIYTCMIALKSRDMAARKHCIDGRQTTNQICVTVQGFYPGGTAIAFRQMTNWASRQGFTEAVRDQFKLRLHGNKSAKLSKTEEVGSGILGGVWLPSDLQLTGTCHRCLPVPRLLCIPANLISWPCCQTVPLFPARIKVKLLQNASAPCWWPGLRCGLRVQLEFCSAVQE